MATYAFSQKLHQLWPAGPSVSSPYCVLWPARRADICEPLCATINSLFFGGGDFDRLLVIPSMFELDLVLTHTLYLYHGVTEHNPTLHAEPFIISR